jgi:hypothetical protein
MRTASAAIRETGSLDRGGDPLEGSHLKESSGSVATAGEQLLGLMTAYREMDDCFPSAEMAQVRALG